VGPPLSQLVSLGLLIEIVLGVVLFFVFLFLLLKNEKWCVKARIVRILNRASLVGMFEKFSHAVKDKG
jgi:hypothetical protein